MENVGQEQKNIEMMLTKDLVTKRIQQIEAEMQQIKAHYAKLEGHLGEAHFWLGELLKKELEAVHGALQDSGAVMDGEVVQGEQSGETNDQGAEQAA